MRVLVIEDNPKLAEAIARGLTEHGLAADECRTGFEGEELAVLEPYDVIILDLMLPDRDGVDVCRNLRRQKVESKILMLTALSSTDDKVEGLDAGADDYLTKPFEFDELLARIRALTRRATATESRVLRYHDLELNLDTRMAQRGKFPIKLSNKEYGLLQYLLRNSDRVLSRAQIVSKVWDMNYEPTSNVVDVYISSLRRKIEEAGGPTLIHTVVGVGYRFGLTEDAEPRSMLDRVNKLLRKFSLRLKLTLWVTAIFTVIQGTFVVVLILFHRDTAFTIFDRQLSNRTQHIVKALQSEDPPWDEMRLAALAADEANDYLIGHLVLVIFDQQQQAVASSTTVQTIRREQAVKQWNDDDAANNTAYLTLPEFDHLESRRALLRPFEAADGQPYLLMADSPLVFVARSVEQIRNVLLLIVPMGTIAVVIAGWYIAGVAVMPLDKVRTAAQELSPESVDQRIDLESGHADVNDVQYELNQARLRLAEGYDAQERFIINVSHELKSPIAVLLTEAQVLLAKHDLPDNAQSFVRNVEEEMRQLGKTAESFLLLAQIQSSKQEPREYLTPLNDIVMDSAQGCATLADQAGVQIAITLFDGGPLTVQGDPELLRTMVDNLVRNAIRFSPCGQPVEVTVQADHNAKTASIAIRDHGPGVPPDLIDHLFDRFVQAGSERKRKRGTGLGLEIARGIARLHEGDITARNLPSGGCEFLAKIPAQFDDPT